MAETYTSNLGLVKPDYDSFADISVINSNMDKIDNAVANAGKVKSVNKKTGDVTLTAADVGALPSGGTAVNANALNGKDASEYLQKSQVVNNFTTTQEGFVADARALKVLNDAQTPLDLVDFTQYVAELANVSYAQNCFYQKMGRLCILQVEFRVSASLVWDEEGSATTAAGIVPIPNRPETGALTTGEQNMSGKFFINTDGSISFRSPMFSSGTMSGRIIYFPKV